MCPPLPARCCKQVLRVKSQPDAKGFRPHQTVRTVFELNLVDSLISEMRQLRIPGGGGGGVAVIKPAAGCTRNRKQSKEHGKGGEALLNNEAPDRKSDCTITALIPGT